MNKLLADAVGFLNGGFAVTIIISFTSLGISMDKAAGYNQPGGPGGYTIAGIVAGVLVAVLVCGMVAVFVEIRNELVRLRKGDKGDTKPAIEAWKTVAQSR